MRKPRRNTKLWLYLYQSGVLNSNDETLIKQKAKEYWKDYDRNRKKRKRASKREYTITFKQEEIKALKFTAHTVGMSIPEYIRQLTRTNILSVPFVAHAQTIKHIEQILIHCKNKINDIAKKETTKNWLGKNNNYDTLTTTIEQIQTTITDAFKQTPTLQEVIRTTISNNPMFIQTIQQIIQSYNDSQKSNT